MSARLLAPVLCLAMASCACSEDPAAGGFYSGVCAGARGTYEKRIEEREAAAADRAGTVEGLETEREGAAAEIAANRARIAELEGRLGDQRARVDRLLAALAGIDREQAALQRLRAEAVFARAEAPAAPAAGTETGADRIAVLEETVAQAASLAEELAGLVGDDSLL